MIISGISGVLLAGGRSRRMGQDKRRLTVGGKPLFQRALSVFQELFPQIIVVVAEDSSVTEGLQHQVVSDLIPGKGPMGGLYTGLSFSQNPYVFLAACDMPFLSPPLVLRLCENTKDSDVSMVQLRTGFQPMQGVYSKKCLSPLKDLIEKDQLQMQNLLDSSGLSINIVDQETIKDLDENFVSFINVNTPSDLEMANKLCSS